MVASIRIYIYKLSCIYIYISLRLAWRLKQSRRILQAIRPLSTVLNPFPDTLYNIKLRHKLETAAPRAWTMPAAMLLRCAGYSSWYLYIYIYIYIYKHIWEAAGVIVMRSTKAHACMLGHLCAAQPGCRAESRKR